MAIGERSGMDDRRKQPALSIDQDVPLAPREFLRPVKAAHATRLGFHGLAVDNGRAGRRVVSCMQACHLPQVGMDL